MASVAAVAADLLKVANDIAGIPFLGAAVTAVQAIAKRCEEVSVQKDKCMLLCRTCQSLLIDLRDLHRERRITEDPVTLRDATTALDTALDRVAGRMWAVSQYNVFKRFWRYNDTGAVLDNCQADITTALQSFKVKAMVHLQRAVEDQGHVLNNVDRKVDDVGVGVNAMNDKLDKLATDIRRLQGRRDDTVTRDGPSLMTRALTFMDQTSQAERAGPPDAGPAYQTVVTQSDRARRLFLDLLEMGILPSDKPLENVQKIGNIAEYGGVYSDIFQGRWGGLKVALKVLRNVRSTDKDRAVKQFETEIRIWAKLQHPNILRFIGVSSLSDTGVALVSPWCENRDVAHFVTEHPDANRMNLILGAAKGLAYLHQEGVIHGNVRCSNILVSSEGEAKLCDFGVSKAYEKVTDASLVATMSSGHHSSLRWMAPEFLRGEVERPTYSTDVYSFGMTILECMTGKKPFAHLKHDAQVMFVVQTRQAQPNRASEIGDGLWSLLLECWTSEPDRRPTMSIVVTRL